MQPVYTQTFTLSDLHLDCFRRLKPSVMLYFIQEVAGQHAAILGTGWETLHEKDLFWAIIRHRIHIERMPEAGETITLKTWPMPTTRVAYPRATEARDEKGNLLFRSIALWVLMDTNTRAMVLPGRSGVTVNGSLQGDELETPPSLPPKTWEQAVCRAAGYTELDRNGHMNNTRYLDWVDDLMPVDFHKEHPIRNLLLCYLSEARAGQQVSLSWSVDGENCLMVEAVTEGEKPSRIFAAKAQF